MKLLKGNVKVEQENQERSQIVQRKRSMDKIIRQGISYWHNA